MDNPCYNCTQKYLDANEEKRKKQEEAQELANKSGEWVGIYEDEFGKQQIALASSEGYFFKAYVTPKLQNS
jgi:hypothetical protein